MQISFVLSGKHINNQKNKVNINCNVKRTKIHQQFSVTYGAGTEWFNFKLVLFAKCTKGMKHDIYIDLHVFSINAITIHRARNDAEERNMKILEKCQ